MTAKRRAQITPGKPGILCILSNPGSWGGENIIAGAEIRTVEILTRWHRLGVPVESLETVPSSSQALGAKYPVHAVSLPVKGYGTPTLVLNTALLFVSYLRKALPLRRRVDTIVTSSSNLLDIAPAWFLSKLWRRPFAVVFQVSCYGPSMRATYRLVRDQDVMLHSLWQAATLRLALRLARSATVAFCLSQHISDTLAGLGFPPEKLHVSGMGLDHAAIDAVPEEEKTYDAVYLGRMEKNKGVEDLLEAWAIVCRERPAAKLLIVGSGTFMEPARLQVEKAGLGAHVDFVGFVASPQKYSYLKKARVFLYPSKIKEGWGLSIAEAMACGLPVVCSDNPVFRGVFGECASVAFSDIGNPSKLAEAVMEMLGDPAVLRQKSLEAERFARQYDWDVIATRDLDVVSRASGFADVPVVAAPAS